MQCRTPDHGTVYHSTGLNLWSQIRIKISLEKQHITRNRSAYNRGTYVHTRHVLLSYSHVMSCLALPCLVLLASSCPSAQCHAIRACHAMPCPAAPCPQPGRAHPPQSSIDISTVAYPALPTIGSQTRLHFGFRTSPTKCPVPRSSPVLSRRVGAQPALPACQSANLPISACLANLVSVCDSRFDSLCLHCLALLCFALLPLARLTSPIPSRLLPLISGRYHHLPSGRRCQSLHLAFPPMT